MGSCKKRENRDTGPVKSLGTEGGARALALLVPFAVYLAGVALLGDWIIDDAGISFAYARNAAAGHGLVSQPGRPPVEGFSNFLWVALLMPLFALRVFEPVFVVKALSALLVLGALALVQRALRSATSSHAPGLFVALLAAAAPPLVIWTASGLENGLTLLLVAALFATSVERPGGWRARCGALAALLAMTHPGGMVFAAWGVVLAFGDEAPREVRLLERLSFAGAFAALFAPFMAFRLAVFGLPLPHTYYAKRVHVTAWDTLVAIAGDPAALLAKLVDLCRGTGGPAGPLLFALTWAAAIYLAARRRLPRHVAVAVGLQIIAVLGYLWIDEDWMGQYRFGTGAVFLSIVAFVSVGCALAGALGASTRTLRARLVGGAVVVAAYASFFPRTVAFAHDPPTPFAEIDRSSRRKLDAYAERLGIVGGSVLLPDVGAMLYASRLTVYDAAGLCEPGVVHTLKRDTPYWLTEHPAFFDYVFEDLRPTFISTHHFWTYVAAFDDDPRFARDYVPIESYEDEYVKSVYHRSLRSGDFVRRDALADFGALARLRAEHRLPPRPDPFVVRLERALGRPLP